MNGGDTDNGGTQVNPRVVPSSSSGPQPVESTSSSVEEATVFTVSHDQPAASSSSQPVSQPSTAQSSSSSTPVIPSEPSTPPMPPVDTPTLQSSPAFSAPASTSPTSSPTFTPISTPTPTTPSNPSAPTQPQATPQPLQPAQPLPPSPLPPQQALPPSLFPPQQPMAQNSNQPVFSNNSDIAIAPPAPKKSRRKFIIIAIIIIVIVLAGIIALFIIKTFNTPNKSQVQSDVRTRLDLYSNYFLYQIDSDTPIGDTVWTTSQMEDFLQGMDVAGQKAYFSRLNQLYADFEAALQGNEFIFTPSEEESIAIFDTYINAVPASLQVFELYLETPHVSKDYMINSYFNLGATEMTSEVTQLYAPFDIPDNAIATEYKDLKISAASTISELYDTYNSFGCINERTLDENCAAMYSEDPTIVRLQSTLARTLESISSTEWNIVTNPPLLSRIVYQNVYLENTNEKNTN